LDDDEAWEIGLTCGGTIEVAIDRVAPSNDRDSVVAAHAVVSAALERGDAAVLVTPLGGAAAALVVTEYGEQHGTLGNADIDAAAHSVAMAAFNAGSHDEIVNEQRLFFDRHVPPTTLVIVGAGEIAVALTHMARDLEMRTIVVDGRDRYATRERFPDASDVRVGMPSEIVAGIAPTKRLALILVAHDYKYELPVLRHLLRTPIGYIGMLGSKTRGAAVRDELRNEGFTDDELARIHSPIGLDLGGKAPPEVALAILAEVIAVRNGKRA
ncbi:MAG TPA: XdhC family protein, partial [Gemmatimonadaceae bacterium]|nr:XdhC family protein [Gemmatimonadaceae bacterium]